MYLRGAHSHHLSSGMELSTFLVGCTVLSIGMLLLTPYLDVQYYLAVWKKKNDDAYVYTFFEHVVQECANVSIFHFNQTDNKYIKKRKHYHCDKCDDMLKDIYVLDTNDVDGMFKYKNKDPVTLEQVVIV